MNIIYNREIKDKQTSLFKLMKEFVLAYLKDKSLFYNITIYFIEVEDENNGLSYCGQCTFESTDPYNAIIQISNYAIKLFYKAYILSNKNVYDTYEKYKYSVIFHELAHIVDTYNDPKLFSLMTHSNGVIYIKEEEKHVNKLAKEFLRKKEIIK